MRDQRLRRWSLVITSIVSLCLVVFTVLLLSAKISDGPCPVIQGASSIPTDQRQSLTPPAPYTQASFAVDHHCAFWAPAPDAKAEPQALGMEALLYQPRQTGALMRRQRLDLGKKL